jgi:hypothetical protein
MKPIFRKGGLSTGMFSSILIAIILIVIIFQTLGDTASTVGYAADNITSKGAGVYPLVDFFEKEGIVLLAFMAGIVLAIIGGVLSFRKR